MTDNPNVFVKADKVISAGNAKSQCYCYGLFNHFITNWVIYQKIIINISGSRGLPYLVSKPSPNSGFMIPQYTAHGLNLAILLQHQLVRFFFKWSRRSCEYEGNATTKLYCIVENSSSISYRTYECISSYRF